MSDQYGLFRRSKTVKVQESRTPGPWNKYSCSRCDEVSESVERRVYGHEYQVLGRPVHFRKLGMNEYCPVCGEPVEYKAKGHIPEPIRGKALTRTEEKWIHE